MVHVTFDPGSLSIADFIQQTGGGRASYFEGIPPYQRGRGQRGAGVGAVFRGLWRYLLPVIRSVGGAVKQEGLATGSRILSNLAEGANLKDTIVNEGKTGVTKVATRLLQKQQGRGYKRRRSPAHRKIIHSPKILGNNEFVRRRRPPPPIKKARSDAFGLY